MSTKIIKRIFIRNNIKTVNFIRFINNQKTNLSIDYDKDNNIIAVVLTFQTSNISGAELKDKSFSPASEDAFVKTYNEVVNHVHGSVL